MHLWYAVAARNVRWQTGRVTRCPASTHAPMLAAQPASRAGQQTSGHEAAFEVQEAQRDASWMGTSFPLNLRPRWVALNGEQYRDRSDAELSPTCRTWWTLVDHAC
eukprot:354887-Chlamydomonas_euryale.AAC.4